MSDTNHTIGSASDDAAARQAAAERRLRPMPLPGVDECQPFSESGTPGPRTDPADGGVTESPERKPIERTVSDKQQAANEANSKKSTGPRSRAGKARSSRNAQRVGTWAKEVTPITRGPFAEDPVSLERKARMLLEDLDLRGSVQLALGKQLVSALVRLDRADRLEAAVLMGVAAPGAEELLAAADPDRLRADQAQVEVLLDSLVQVTGGVVPTLQIVRVDREERQIDWQTLAVLLRMHSPDPRVGVKDLWNDTETPIDDRGWQTAVRALYRHHWGDPDALKAYLLQRWLDLGHRIREAVVSFAASSARRQLKASDEIVNRPRTAAWKDFERALKALQQLQANDGRD